MNDPDEIRTRNLLIRSQTPYPLGHEAIHTSGDVQRIISGLRKQMTQRKERLK